MHFFSSMGGKQKLKFCVSEAWEISFSREKEKEYESEVVVDIFHCYFCSLTCLFL